MARKKTSSDDELFAAIAKETGGDLLSDRNNTTYYLDTGSLAVNYIMSGKFVGGGLAGGRIIEVYGPSSSGKSFIAANAIFGCQKLNGICAILDCENATNGPFMQKTSHLNLKQVIRYTPQSLESAFRKIHTGIKTIRTRVPDLERPILFVYDSISVSPCERELKENDLPDNYKASDWKKLVGRKEQPGERAKICGNELRKLQGILERTNTNLLIINQTREKIGVMYGCHSGKSLVYLADGSTKRIDNIVKDRDEVDVLSFNPITNVVESRRVIGWHDNGFLGDGESFLKIKFRRQHRNAFGYLRCTPNHILFAEKNSVVTEIPAGDIVVGDKLAVVQPFHLNQDQWQVMYGSVLGDGSIQRHNRSQDSLPQMRWTHCTKQKDYLLYKVGLMGKHIATTGQCRPHKNKATNGFAAESTPLYELNCIAGYKEDYNIPEEIADNLNELGLAIWYLDDGTYSGHNDRWGNGKSIIYCTKFHNREIMFRAFKRLGLNPTLTKRGFKFDSDETRKMHEMISRFVPESMEYKIHPMCRGLFGFNNELDKPVEYRQITGEVISVEPYSHPHQRHKFDITVEGNANYVVAGAIVHNSPETTAGGGRGLPFYAAQRFRTSTKKKIENKRLGTFAGVNMKVQNVKNRLFRPFVESEGIQLYFENGINPIAGLLSLLIQSERVTGSSGTYSVASDYLPEGASEYKFRANKERNDVPLKTLMDCPKLVDASDQAELDAYLAPFLSAIGSSSSKDFSEKAISFDEEGNPVDADDDVLSDITEMDEGDEETEEEQEES
jgi:recombination protein RecA